MAPVQAPMPPAMQPNPAMAVSIRGLFKRFGNKVAVNGLSLDIPTGSFYGLVGPNGAGKTTTINMLTGLLVPDGGVAMILGHNVWQDVNAAKRLIGLMPQPEQIFPTLTGMQLVVYAGMLRGMPRAEAAARAKDLIAAFDLTAAANIMVRDYSAGMTKKICLATAMIHSPRILVLDEPFESVDPVSSANIKDILVDYVHTGGTVVISSHVMALVERMCTHVAVVNQGQVVAAGTVAQVAAGEDLEERFLQLVGGRHGAAQQRAGRMVRSHVGLLLSVPSAAPLGRLPMPLSGPRQGARGVAELSANRGGVYTRRALPGKEVQVNVRKSDRD